MKGRLLQSIIGTVLEELAIAGVLLLVLPRFGVRIPVWGTVLVMAGWAAYSIFTYRLGTTALLRKNLTGQTDMKGCQGNVVKALNPEGLVRIKGELWAARVEGGDLGEGKPVLVVEQDRLKLIVRECTEAELLNTKS